MKGWRTLLWSALIATAGVLEVTDFAPLVPDRYEGWTLLAIALVTAWLRVITTSPIGGCGRGAGR